MSFLIVGLLRKVRHVAHDQHRDSLSLSVCVCVYNWLVKTILNNVELTNE